MDTSIARIERFSELSADIQQEFAQRGRFKQVERGEILFFEGDDCAHLYLVVSGSIKIAKTLESGKELIIDIIGAGEAVGEVALVDALPFPATASGHETSQIFLLARDDYLGILERYPAVALATIRDLAFRLRNINRRMKEVSGGNVEYRIAHLLLSLANRLGQRDGERLHIHLALSRQEIADAVGTSLETAIRIMSRWRKDGVVETDQNGFVIGELNRLIEISESSL